MKLTAEQARSVVQEDNFDWVSKTTDETTGNSRWSIHKEQIFEHTPTHKFYRFQWSVGATESQDEQPFEYVKDYEPTEVTLITKTIQIWEEING